MIIIIIIILIIIIAASVVLCEEKRIDYRFFSTLGSAWQPLRTANHPFIPKDHDLIDCATTPWLIRDIRTTHVMAGEGQPQISARLAGTQNTARDSARLARSASVPAFSSRGAQLSARYSTRKSTGRRSGSRRSLQNTARSSLDTTRSAALRVTLGYTERRPKDQAKSKVDPLGGTILKGAKRQP